MGVALLEGPGWVCELSLGAVGLVGRDTVRRIMIFGGLRYLATK